jgi:hypothetical protein
VIDRAGEVDVERRAHRDKLRNVHADVTSYLLSTGRPRMGRR